MKHPNRWVLNILPVAACLFTVFVAIVAEASPILARPEFLDRCGSRMTQEQYGDLLSVTDTTAYSDFHEASFRTQRIASLFSNAFDRRGIFASSYAVTTVESVRALEAYHDQALAGRLVYEFTKRYFNQLHAYLVSGSNSSNQSQQVSKSAKSGMRISKSLKTVLQRIYEFSELG